MQPIKLTPSAGGWVYADWGDDQAWVRFGKDKRDRLAEITEIHLYNPTPERLKRVPLKRIQAAATFRGASLVQLPLAMRFNEEPPADLFSQRPADNLVLKKRFKLQRPTGRLLDDQFYADVAHAYQAAVAFGLRPRKTIVEDTGAADATVAAWVGEARKRGFLAKAEPGKVSAEEGKKVKNP
jgi:hypothetical protein